MQRGIKMEKKLTRFHSELPYSSHSDEKRVFITNKNCFLIPLTVVPSAGKHTWDENTL